jgi:hypothetical protein
MVLTHENIQRRMEHWDLIRRVDPYQLKFCGEKSIRGAYNVIGISSIASNATPFLYFVNEGGRSNSEVFTNMVLYAISRGFLRRGDVLVLNNATYHRGREASDFDDYMWRKHRIYLHFLPPRSPELNPAKLLLNPLTQQLKYVPLTDRYGYRSDQIVRAATMVMDQLTHQDVYACYCHCNYITYR